jgi:hypothetical protein
MTRREATTEPPPPSNRRVADLNEQLYRLERARYWLDLDIAHIKQAKAAEESR